MNMQVLDARRDASGGYKVDVSRGSHNGRVSSEWFSRPDDQRYLSLDELASAVRGRSERSRTRVIESALIHVEANRNDPERLALMLPGSDEPVAPTHWSFGQLASQVGAPAAYLRQLPAPLAAINLQYGLTSHRAEQIKTLETDDPVAGRRVELRAVTGPDYGRIYDHELVEAVQKIAGNGTGDTRWKVPGVLDWSTGIYNPNVDISKDTTTLYASDRDVFLFLVDDLNPIEAGRLPDGSPDLFFRGFYCWNSEVGAKTLGMASFYLRHDGPEHVLCFAPTRSGKGVGLVIPTLLTWSGSAIVHDIKGENWGLTAGFRSGFSRVLLFDPTNLKSAAYNPLLEVRRGMWEVRDVQNVADVLVDPEGSLEKRNHWEKTSHALLVGAILHVLYAEPDKTLAGVAAFLSDPSRTIETTLKTMMTTPHLGEAGPHPVVASAARELLNKSENERSGVLSTAMSFLGLYRDPVIAEVTRRSEWRIADLVDGKKPVTLYLVVPPSDINRTKPLIRLILNQIGRRLTEELEAGKDRHRMLLMLDEFPALGRLDFFESALAFMAGYGLKAFLIAQSLNQIERAYGANNSILDNCHVRVAFATNDERTAKRVSESLGTATEQRSMRNYAGHRLSPWLGHLMISRYETSRPLLTQGEILQLPETDEIVMLSGAPPLRAKKARYYADPRLQGRIQKPPQPRQDRTRDLPADDWSQLPVVKPVRPVTPQSSVDEDHANGGARREPELPLHVEIAPPSIPQANEFDFGSESDNDDDAARSERLRARMVANSQQAALDPGDGIEL